MCRRKRGEVETRNRFTRAAERTLRQISPSLFSQNALYGRERRQREALQVMVASVFGEEAFVRADGHAGQQAANADVGRRESRLDCGRRQAERGHGRRGTHSAATLGGAKSVQLLEEGPRANQPLVAVLQGRIIPHRRTQRPETGKRK